MLQTYVRLLRYVSSVFKRSSLISARSKGKPVPQSILERYEQTMPNPSFPWWIWNRRPSESRQSSANKESNHALKVSNMVSHSGLFITLQILSSVDPFGTEDGREFERLIISLTRSLMSVTVNIDRAVNGIGVEHELGQENYWEHKGQTK